MSQNSLRLRAVEYSPILEITEAAERLKERGVDVISMAAGRPDFPTPVHIVEAAKSALDNGYTSYTHSRGLIELRRAVAEKLQADNGLLVDPETDVLITVGAKEALFSTLIALVEEGDEVLLPDPGYPGYVAAVRLAGGIPRFYSFPRWQGEPIDFDRLAGEFTSRTRLLILNTPHNPTGVVLNKDELVQIGQICAGRGVLIVSDEIYEKFVYEEPGHLSVGSLPQMHDHVITINGFSKAYAMTGWRVGYLTAREGLVSAINKVHSNSVTCAPAFAQKAAVSALRGPQIVGFMVRTIQDRTKRFCAGLDGAWGIEVRLPAGTFYAFVRVSWPSMTSQDIARMLLQEAGIAVVPGRSYGERGEGYLRFSLTVPDSSIAEAAKRITRLAERLEKGVSV